MINPLDLRGPEFLQLFAALCIVAVGIGFLIRYLMRYPWNEQAVELLRLQPDEIAFIAGGPHYVVETTLARLLRLGNITLDSETKHFKPTKQPTTLRQPHQIEISKCIHLTQSGASFNDIALYSEERVSTIADRLVQLGLIMSSARALLYRIATLLPLAVVLFLGITKIFIGLSRNRPVFFLMLLCLITVGVGFFLFLKWKTFQTIRGANTLQYLREKNSALERTAERDSERLSADDLVLAMGLFGPAVLEFGQLGAFHQMMHARKPESGFWSSNSGSSCSSFWGTSSCSTGSGCGGGGGCGGCGGCGS